jgi:hypothetical protein
MSALVKSGGEGVQGRADRRSPGRGAAVRIAPFVLCAAGVAFIAIGMWRGEVATVLMKAIRICLECIGIG